MNPILKTKILSFIKNLVTIAVLIFVSTFIEIYWSMGSLSEKLFKGHPDSDFIDEAYLISVFTTAILTVLFLLFTFIKNKKLKIALELISLISIWFFCDYVIFVYRESSWSTYLFREEILHTLFLSFFPILVLSLVTVFSLHYISKKYESK